MRVRERGWTMMEAKGRNLQEGGHLVKDQVRGGQGCKFQTTYYAGSPRTSQSKTKHIIPFLRTFKEQMKSLTTDHVTYKEVTQGECIA